VSPAILDLDWITPELAVGGAPPQAEGPALLAAAGVGAVVDLRAEGRDDPSALAARAIRFLHLPTEDHCALAQADMDAGAAFVRGELEAGRRVLVHCREGIGRSVTLMLCVLVDGGAEPLEAMGTIKAHRYWASPSPAQFDAFAEWLHRRGVAPPPFAELAAIAYRHLA
jgi:protein-tyrosine phosphatase